MMFFNNVLFFVFSLYNLQTIRGDTVFWQQPEQVHIAYGKNIFEIVVTWSTSNRTNSSIVEYGIGGLILRQEGSSKLFIDGGPEKRSQYIHTVVLKHLTPDSRYGELVHSFFFIRILSLNLFSNFKSQQKFELVAADREIPEIDLVFH